MKIKVKHFETVIEIDELQEKTTFYYNVEEIKNILDKIKDTIKDLNEKK